MKCNCGHEIDIPKFCPHCGKPVPKVEPPFMASEAKPPPTIMTVQEIASFLHISKPTVYQLIKEGGLPWFALGQHKRFITEEVIQWAKSQQRTNDYRLYSNHR